MIPRKSVIEVLERQLPPEAEIRRLDTTSGQFSIDVSAPKVTIEPRVGDIVEGGLRIYSHIQPARGQKQQPRVSSYWFRLECLNGNTRAEENGQISLKGTTVDEVIEEMERAAQHIWGEVVPRRLEQFAHLTEEKISEAEIAMLLHRLARENGIGEKIESAALDALPGLHHRTMYDLLNLLNGLQNEEGVRGVQKERLIELSGNVITSHSERCPNCLTALE